MASDGIVASVAVNLGFGDSVPAPVRDNLVRTVEDAEDRLRRQMRIPLDLDSPSDRMLLVEYSMWLYESRRGDKPMTPSLRLRLNDRTVHKVSGGAL